MKKKKRFQKKFIFSGVAALLIVGILSLDLAKNVSVAEARQNVFTQILPYQSSGLKILEVTPTVDDKELGYFFPTNVNDELARSVANVTHGTKFNSELPGLSLPSMSPEEIEQEADRRAWARVEQDKTQGWYNPSWYNDQQKHDEYLPQERQNVQRELEEQIRQAMGQMDPYLAAVLRSYGMIKPSGSDLGTGTNSEYPIYDRDRKGVFGSVGGTNDYIEIDIPAGNMAQGHYVINENNTGSYKLADGYCIGTGEENFDGDAVGPDGVTPITGLDRNYIYKKTLVENPDPSVSGNDPGQVSGNTTEDKDVYKYEKIAYQGGIPEGVTFVGGSKDGNLDFTFLPNQTDIYYGYTVDKIVYLNNNRWYRVGNWIKEYVLGDAELGCQVTYEHRTLDALTEADIQNADLIYLSGTAAEYKEAGLDMNPALVKEIYNQSAIYHKAVIMDSTIYSGGAEGFTNLDKLALLLWQDDQKLVSSWDSCSSYFIEKPADPGAPADDTEAEKEYLIDNINALLGTNDVFSTLQSTMVTGYNGTFAVNNIYVYNHHFSDFQSSKLAAFQRNALDNIANGDLNSIFTATAANGGFQSVLAYIKLNNEKITTGKMSEGYVTPAIAIQYILCYRGEDLALAKSAYAVLEIQPTKQFKFNSGLESKDYTLETPEVKENRSAFIRDCLNEDIVKSGNQELVTFDSVTVDAFNTMQTDVLTSYDVVYIGALHTAYYEHVEGTSAAIELGTGFVHHDDASIPTYNDDGMDGCVYFNYGDMIENNWKEAYSSRDLTEAKLLELKDYLQKSGLIIVDEDLMKSIEKGNTVINPTKVNSASTAHYDNGRMDDSSNMYELFTFARGGSVSGQDAVYYGNLVSEGDLKNSIVKKADLTSYLNRERLSMLFTTKPSEYTYAENDSGLMTIVTYQAADRTDGKYYLDYEFVINNTAAVADAAEFYEVHLYQDMNADGRFDAAEEKFDYSVTLAADGTPALNGKDADGVTHYSLNGGVAYKLRRQVPSDEGGIIDWCLKVEKINDRNIYCQETGYTAIKPREKKYINILQIMPDSANGLENLRETDILYRFLHSLAVEDQYEITIRSVSASQFQRDTQNYYTRYRANFESDEALWQDYFNNFERTASDNAGYTTQQIEADEDKPMAVNMLILGFSNFNGSQFTVAHPVNAIRSYMDTNKPVLTSRYVVSPNISVTDPNRTLNYSFLSYFGQDRYGYTNPLYNRAESNVNTDNFYNRTEQLAYNTYIGPREAANNAVAYMPNSARALSYLIPIGYTNAYRARQRTDASILSGDYAYINTQPVKSLYGSNDPTAIGNYMYVDKMNEGQISHYPYVLNDQLLISRVMEPYFQLDLDTDSDGDGNSDIVVWYTMGDVANGAGTVLADGGVYSSTPGDGINNYYVYNYGNVTYTSFGSGFNESTHTKDDAKLFVNTLIAAYEAGLVNPTVSYYETADSNASMLESIAVPYDVNVTGNNTIDSSIQMNETGTDYLYKFVNPNTNPETAPSGTKAYFKVQDSNLVKGDKTCKVEFYLGVEDTSNHRYLWPDGTISDILNIQLSDNTVVSVVRIPIDIYRADFSAKVGTSNGNAALNPRLEVGMMYGFYAPMSYLNDNGAAEIYIQADTSYRVLSSSTGQYVDRPLGTAYDMFTMIKQDLLKLD